MKYKNVSKSKFTVFGGEVLPGQIVDIQKDSHQSVKVLAKHKEFQPLGSVHDSVAQLKSPKQIEQEAEAAKKAAAKKEKEDEAAQQKLDDDEELAALEAEEAAKK